MVLCKKCGQRVVSRTMNLQSIMPKHMQGNDELGSDPSMLTIGFRCVSCKIEYFFKRVLTSDELIESNRKIVATEGCGGCGG